MTHTAWHRLRASLAIALSAALVSLALSSVADAALRHFDGTVVSKNAAKQTFKADTENHGRLRFRVNDRTEFERIPGGFSGLERGMRIEIEAKKKRNGYVARKVERDRE